MSKSSQERIDHVLNALRDAEPPIGLEQRVAARIASRAAETTEERTANLSRLAAILNAARKPRVIFASVTTYALAGAALVVLLAIIAVSHVSHRSPHTVARTRPVPVAAGAHAHPEQALLTSPRPMVRARPNKPSQPALPQPTSATAQTNPDTIALAETLAPSHPAPPMPMTQQEQLMLNVLRSGDQQEIAALNPTERDALFAQDQAAFRAFFTPSTPEPTNGDKE